MTKENRLFLIDGMALIYRAHFAMINNPLMTRDGRHTSAIFGFMNGMMKVIRDENPDHLAVVLDSPQPTFRHEIYTDYKATREKMPEELVEQLQPLYDLLTAANIPIIRFPGYEADDIIGTLAYQAHDLGWKTYMVTGDKDMMQLVTDSVFMYTPGNRFKPTTIYDRQGVLDKWGVGPEKIIELLALVGDSSDNVPGIDGVGPKTAVKLLNEYGTLENIVENAEYLRNKRVRNGFLEGKDILPMSKDLVTIRLDVPVALHLNELQRKAPDFDALEQQLSELEMTSLLRQFQMSASAPKNEPSETVNPDKNYTIVLTDAELKAMIKKLSAAEIISFDVETTSVTALIANLVGMSFSIEAHAGWYIPIDYPERNDTDSSSMNLDDILKALKPLFEDEAVKFCGQNIKYDALVMSRYNIEVNGIIFDTMIAAHLLRPEANSYKLDVLSRDYLHYQMVPISDLIGSGKNQKSMAEVPLKEIFYYAAEDADIALQITGLFKEQLKDQEMEKPFYEVEMPLVPVLIEMEKNGVYLDLDFLKTLSVDFGEQLDELEEKIHDLAGSDFNVNSPQQLAVILFDELGLKPIRKRSTDVNVLERLKNHHPLPKLVLDYRHLKKLKSTYIDAFPQYVNPHTGRVHTSLNQTIAATGRLSSTNPNFQNIPIRTELGRDIRKAFRVQNPGYVLLSADYSQVELRIMAHFSGEPELVKAFREEQDIHRQTASLVFNLPPELVTDDMRRSAKVVNFGIMYGAGPYRMSQELNIPMGQARELIDNYFKTYPGIKDFVEKTLKDAREKGYVETLMGRRRNMGNLNSQRTLVAQAEERAAVNMPIQGTAAELIKLAMINIHHRLKKEGLSAKLILQIHDELLLEVPENEIDTVSSLVVEEMESAMELSVPLKVEFGVGDNWYEAH